MDPNVELPVGAADIERNATCSRVPPGISTPVLATN